MLSSTINVTGRGESRRFEKDVVVMFRSREIDMSG